jgi:nucleoside 2-deoxyribosyltransferase
VNNNDKKQNNDIEKFIKECQKRYLIKKQINKTRNIKTKFDWKDYNVYLAGAIDFYNENKIDWREDVKDKLLQIGFSSNNVLSPFKKPIHKWKNIMNAESSISLSIRKQKKWGALVDCVSQIAQIDLRLVDKSDFVIAFFPHDKNNSPIFTVGTIHEIIRARQQDKPLMVVWPSGISKCSSWLMWLAGHENIFNNFDSLVKRLSEYSTGKRKINTKDWLLFNFTS